MKAYQWNIIGIIAGAIAILFAIYPLSLGKIYGLFPLGLGFIATGLNLMLYARFKKRDV